MAGEVCPKPSRRRDRRCYAPDGDLIGKAHLPETCADLCFGGRKRNRIFMVASTSIDALYVDVQGMQLPYVRSRLTQNGARWTSSTETMAAISPSS